MITIQLSTQSPYRMEADVLVLLTHHARKQGILRGLDKRLDGHLSDQFQREEFEAKDGQKLSCNTLGKIEAPRLLLVGLGEKDDDMPQFRKAAASSIRAVKNWKPTSLAIAFAQSPKNLGPTIEGLALGAWLASYHFNHYKSGDNHDSPLKDLTLLLPARTSAAVRNDLEATLHRVRILAESIITARDLVNEPPNTLTPTELANRAEEMAAKVGLECDIFGPSELREWGMNLFLAVSVGSVEEPRLIHMRYIPKGRRKRKNAKVLALVGKGVTFDSGGLSIKPTSGMVGMHADMAGAAAVFGAIQAIAQLKPTIEVHCFIGATENMTGAAAYRINDIVKGYNGKFVEIKNTDAEGRLVLADTMAYAANQGVTEIIDVATLTGACLVALGPWTAGLMSNQQSMADNLLEASHSTGESIWQLPLIEELRPTLKSHTADLANVGGRYGGAITAGLFLREFVPEDLHWTHLDIAGPSFADKDLHHISKGGTGFGVTTLVQYTMKQK